VESIRHLVFPVKKQLLVPNAKNTEWCMLNGSNASVESIRHLVFPVKRQLLVQDARKTILLSLKPRKCVQKLHDEEMLNEMFTDSLESFLDFEVYSTELEQHV
jgi:hypothetical protein